MAKEQDGSRSSSTPTFRKCSKETISRRSHGHSFMCFINMPTAMWPFLLLTCLLVRFAPLYRYHRYSFENSFPGQVNSRDWWRSSENENFLPFSFSGVVHARPRPGGLHHGHSWIYFLHKPSLKDAFRVNGTNKSGKSAHSSDNEVVSGYQVNVEPGAAGDPMQVAKSLTDLDAYAQRLPEPEWSSLPAEQSNSTSEVPKDSQRTTSSEQLQNSLSQARILNNTLSYPRYPKPCAGVEEMGLAAAGDTRDASLRLRRAIREYFNEHGAERVRHLPPEQFCYRNFVIGKASAAGFGNNMYKILTAAGLGLILKRSLIIAETGVSFETRRVDNKDAPLTFPFGDYISYSSQAFSMREVKQLWSNNECTEKYGRPLELLVDLFQSPMNSTVLCKDWTQWKHPILWFTDTPDTNGIQFLLKNRNVNVRSAARLVLGDPSQPDSRPNTFGELMRAIVEPKPEIKMAVEWTLSRPDTDGNPSFGLPDIAVHLRMQHVVSKTGLRAATNCIAKIVKTLPEMGHRRPRILVVSDTPAALAFLRRDKLANVGEIISFDYQAFLKSPLYNSSDSASVLRVDSSLPAPFRRKDWGPSPRWVAIVDFFVAASAKHAVVSGAFRRVATTYAQLIGSLAAAYTLADSSLDSSPEHQAARFYSSFQEELLTKGLRLQSGWGHSWRPFGGVLTCNNQQEQCALTPVFPYAWWDGPWESPNQQDIRKMKGWGIPVNREGILNEKSLMQFCQEKQKVKPHLLSLALPSPKKLRVM